ncbi:MAG TPA: hypothetical protein VL400_09275, partial [Polyangiaceae bacterium]|nr:hypothetical protein [Polyangiaceae bacterium]
MSMAVAAACGPSDGAAPSASASANGPTPTPSVATPASAEIEDELSTRPVELLKLKFASGVKNKEPDGVLESAKPGQRVYVHLTL